MEVKQPLVSIITITRNRGNLIHRAIESILQQTYTNFEHIVVDGASTDNTKDIVTSYNDSRIKYIELPENFSIPKTINIGFANSQGEYITFLDDDDEYLPIKIEKQLNLIQSLPEKYGLVYCWMSYFDDKTKDFIHMHKCELRGNVATNVVSEVNLSGAPTLFFRRSSFELLGGWKDDIGIVSDWELVARACQTYLVDYVPESLVKVYINHGALRMSEKGYYSNNLERLIIFHSYFLSEFKDVFDKYPQKKAWHLYMISRSYFLLGEWKKGWKCYKELLMSRFLMKSLLLPAYCMIKRK
jgi:glycosyltransferase involved in cell wall biosynthesis